MSKQNKLLEKLIKASGGWERFLYTTIDDLYTTVDDAIRNDDGVFDCKGQIKDALEEARTVVEFYEEQHGAGEPCEIEQPKQVQSSQVQEAPNVGRPIEPKESVVPSAKAVLSDVPKPKPQPRVQTAQVSVDKDAGASQGELPVPPGHALVDRRNLVVMTSGRLELGRGSEDGQVRGPGASGHVSLSGTYRLVFKEATLGIGLIEYQIVQKEE